MNSAATLRLNGVNRRIFVAATAVTVSMATVKLVAVFKELTVASAYGRSDALEAFLLAALIPGLVINLISESMNQALIPALVRVREQEGRESAQRLLSNSMLSTCVMLVAGSAIMAASARLLFPVIGSHFSAAKLDLTIRLFYGLLPVIVLTGIASSCAAVLNTAGEFAIPAIAPIVTPLAFMALVPLLARTTGPWAMVYAMIVGAVIHTAWMAIKMNSQCYPLRFRWYGMNDDTREVARQFGPVMLSGLVASSGLVVDHAMAAMLPAGSLSALAYAGRFVGVALALLGGGVSAAVTPMFSEMVASRDWQGCGRSLRMWAWSSVSAATLVALFLIASSRLLVRLTLEHGVFGREDTAAVSPVLMMYAIQIPFFVCSRIFYRFLVVMRRADIVFYCGLLNLALDVILNFVLMRWLGVAGIALATSLWTVSTLIFLWYWSRKVLLRVSETFSTVRGSD